MNLYLDFQISDPRVNQWFAQNKKIRLSRFNFGIRVWGQELRDQAEPLSILDVSI